MNPSTSCGHDAAGLRAAGQTFPLYLRRVARGIVIRTALRGRIAWPVALLMLRRLDLLEAHALPGQAVQASAPCATVPSVQASAPAAMRQVSGGAA